MPESLRKKDFSDECQTLIANSITQATLNLENTLVECFAFEKKCRVAGDLLSLKNICVHIVGLCRSTEDWERLNAALQTINKRRNQSKNAIMGSVETAMSYIDTVVWPSKEVKVSFLTTLKDVCAGKMFLEAESARLHLSLSKILEADGNIPAACDMIQDVHVETFGSLSKKEKAEYILEQIRLNLLRKDFIRALIQSRKMNRKVIEDEEFEEVKVAFYRMMIEYYTQEKDAWEICQCYFKLYEVAEKQGAEEEAIDALQACVIFLVLSKFNNDQVDMMHRLKLITEKSNIPEYHNALTLFTTKEVIPRPFSNQGLLEAHESIGRGPTGGEESRAFFIKSFHSRIVEHNIRVISGYYTRIHVARLCGLIDVTQAELENFLSDMLASGDINVKIDRPAGIINFGKVRPAEVVLSDWSSDIGKLLNMMESTCHLINRENMIYKV